MLDKLLHITNFRFEISNIKPSEYCNTRNMLSSESKFKGKFDINRTPYMKKVIDHFSPYSNKNVIALMKGHQIGANALLENAFCYRIKHCPTNMMLVTANEKLQANAMSRIDKAIDGFDIRHLITIGNSLKRKTKSSGDTMFTKHFAGGSLISFGGQSLSNMRSNPVQIVAADECDTYKLKDEKAGSFISLMNDRTSSFGEERIIFYGSTPLLKESSIIESVFLQGDQQYYNLPCPCCGEYYPLVWYGKNENGTRYGVMFDVKKNRVVKDSVRYRCPKCENEWRERKYKTDILLAGEWKETAEPFAENYTSFHISSLYAPIGMKGWYDYANQFQEAYPRAGFADEVKLQSFNNSVLGLSWETKGKIPKINKLQNNTRNYKIGSIPYDLCKEDNNGDIVLLTCACDLNGRMNGYQGYNGIDDVRLDYEIIAWSEKGASYSIDAGSIGTFESNRKKEEEGRIRWTYKHNDENSVWGEFEEIIRAGYDGMAIVFTAVDSSNYTEHAMDFVKKMQSEGLSVYGFKGDKPESFRMTSEDKQLFRKSKEIESLYLINVNRVKDNLSNYIQLEAEEDYQPSNFMNFPNSSNGKYDYKNYFSHYEGEQRKLKKNANNIDYYLWERRSGRHNHFWDCRVYNLAIREIISDMVCREAGVDNIWSNTCIILKSMAA